jgi:small subunit ribosomal protein S4e
MANKGNSGHIKRLNAPRYFAIHRKEHKYSIKQNPGRHSLDKSVALTLLIGKLGLASTRRDADRIIKGGMVSVNGKAVKDPKYPIGLHDVLAVGSEKFMISINHKGQINPRKNEKESQVYKIVGKYKYTKGKVMLRLHDGTTLNGSADANVNDSVKLSDGKLSKLIKLGAGAKCEVIDGVHMGRNGTVKSISEGSMHRTKSVLVEEQNGTKFETLVKNIIVVE